MHLTKTMGVYALINLANAKVYIGSTNNIAVRRSRHLTDLAWNRHSNKYLQHAYNKHGGPTFEFRILEVVTEMSDLIPCEQKWIDQCQSYDKRFGYNLMPSVVPVTHSEESKLLISRKNKGMKRSPETRARMSEAWKKRQRKPLSAEHKEKLRVIVTGRKPSAETRAKISAAQKGRKGTIPSAETRAKMSAAHKGKPKSAEHRAKIGAAHKGRKLSPEQREKLAAIQQNRSSETRAKMSDAHSSLTIEQVGEIRRRAAQGEHPKALASEFHLSRTSIYDIVRYRTYKHIE